MATDTKQVSNALARIRRARARGDGFASYDAALKAVRRHPDSLVLQYQAVLQAARIGALSEAARLFDQFGLAMRSGEAGGLLPLEDLLTLAARLRKDRALEDFGPNRAAELAEAAQAYLAVFKRTGGYYPLVNAADLLALAGDGTAATRNARQALRLLRDLPATADGEETSWRLLSAVEAHLVLGQTKTARKVAAAARSAFHGNLGDLSSTVRQLTQLVAALGLDFVPGGELGMPSVLAYSGHIIAPPGKPGSFPAAQEADVAAAIAQALAGETIGWAYGSLAAGADLLVVEALQRRRVGVHAVLPFEQNEFIEVSVRPAGEQWVRRFERCRARLASCRIAVDGGYFGDDALFGACTAYALGLASQQATQNGAALTQLLVWDGRPRPGATAGTAADLERGRALGLRQSIIATQPEIVVPAAPVTPAAKPPERRRHLRAMIFADVVGFSRIQDDDLPHFHSSVMTPMAEAIAHLPTAPSVVETWGDAVFLVYDDVGLAAQAAMSLVRVLDQADRAALGLPAHLNLRVSAHYGAVLDITNPFTGRAGCLGLHVSRAARIEPVTPPGVVYVSEAFAAQLALLPGTGFRADFVGTTKLAKKFGDLPAFRLIQVASDTI